MRLHLAALLAATSISPSAALAQSTNANERAVAANYATTYGVSEAEAKGRLDRLDEIMRVEKALTEKFPNQFGGLYVVHDPDFKVVVK